jgi:hypothetical protein
MYIPPTDCYPSGYDHACTIRTFFALVVTTARRWSDIQFVAKI